MQKDNNISALVYPKAVIIKPCPGHPVRIGMSPQGISEITVAFENRLVSENICHNRESEPWNNIRPIGDTAEWTCSPDCSDKRRANIQKVK